MTNELRRRLNEAVVVRGKDKYLSRGGKFYHYDSNGERREISDSEYASAISDGAEKAKASAPKKVYTKENPLKVPRSISTSSLTKAQANTLYRYGSKEVTSLMDQSRKMVMDIRNLAYIANTVDPNQDPKRGYVYGKNPEYRAKRREEFVRNNSYGISSLEELDDKAPSIIQDRLKQIKKNSGLLDGLISKGVDHVFDKGKIPADKMAQIKSKGLY